jgi:hypothetical protein
LTFVSPWTGPGVGSASSVSAEIEGRATKHTIEWLPWLRCFRITWQVGPDSKPLRARVLEHRVANAELYEDD